MIALLAALCFTLQCWKGFGTGVGLALGSVRRLQKECWETQIAGTSLWKKGLYILVNKWSLPIALLSSVTDF